MEAVSRRSAQLPRLSPATAALIVALCHGAWLLWRGIQMAADSKAYAYWSARLLESGFDYPLLTAEAAPSFPAIFYAAFATLLAVLRLLFGEYWQAALVALNFAGHVGLGALVVRLATAATGGSPAGAWTALLLFLGCHDILRWVPFVLSDSSFVFLAFCIFSLAAARILDTAKRWWVVAPPAALGVFYRPTGIVLLADLLWAAFLSRARRLPPPWMMAALLGGAGLAGAIAFAWFVADPQRWPFEALSSAFRTVGEGYAVGEVVSGRPETWHAPPGGMIDILLISADRFFHFFAIGAAGYSAGHWIVATAFFLPCYALAGWLCIALWRGDSGLPEPQRRLFLAAAGAVLAYAAFHALVQVDFDWRYRLPVLPHLILLAAGGAADLARRAGRT